MWELIKTVGVLSKKMLSVELDREKRRSCRSYGAREVLSQV